MHGVLSGAMAASLLAAVAMVMVGRNDAESSSTARDVPTVVASTAPVHESAYRLWIGNGERSCTISKASDGTEGRFEATAGPKCPGVYPPLAEVRLWHEKNEGTVELAREDGTIVLELAVSDGLAFESFQPGLPLISLVLVD